MALPNPRTWVADEVVTAALLNTEIRDSVDFFLNRPYAYLTRSSDQSISAGATIAFPWNSEHFDTHNGHDPSTNNTRYTIQESGVYLMAVTIPWSAGTGGPREVWFRLNGTTGFAQMTIDTPDSNIYSICTMSQRSFVAGDYVEVRVNNGSGTSKTIPASFHNGPLWSIIWLRS